MAHNLRNAFCRPFPPSSSRVLWRQRVDIPGGKHGRLFWAEERGKEDSPIFTTVKELEGNVRALLPFYLAIWSINYSLTCTRAWDPGWLQLFSSCKFCLACPVYAEGCTASMCSRVHTGKALNLCLQIVSLHPQFWDKLDSSRSLCTYRF